MPITPQNGLRTPTAWALTAVLVVSLASFLDRAYADVPAQRFASGDNTLAGVSLRHDGELDVTTKLGNRACAIPGLNAKGMSHYYLGADGTFLRFDVGGRGVEAMTMSSVPLASGICYAPVREGLMLQTGRGLRLGDSIAKITALYGQPHKRQQRGAATHFHYFFREQQDGQYEWHLVFRDGHLVKWMAKLAGSPLRSRSRETAG